jgi:hypothetical protein
MALPYRMATHIYLWIHGTMEFAGGKILNAKHSATAGYGIDGLK